jgi:hypothetical protein
MNDPKEAARSELEDAVYRALEAGMTPAQVLEEVKYALEAAEA